MAKHPVTPDHAEKFAQLLSMIEAKRAQTPRRESARYLKYNAADFAALRFIGTEPRATPSALARHLGLVATTVTSLLDRLEGRELIARAPSTRDRRATALTLTARGRRALAAIEAEDRAFATRLLSVLDGRDQEAALAMVSAMTTGPEGERSPAPAPAPKPKSKAKRTLLGRKAKPSAQKPTKTSAPKMTTDRMGTDRLKR